MERQRVCRLERRTRRFNSWNTTRLKHQPLGDYRRGQSHIFDSITFSASTAFKHESTLVETTEWGIWKCKWARGVWREKRKRGWRHRDGVECGWCECREYWETSVV